MVAQRVGVGLDGGPAYDPSLEACCKVSSAWPRVGEGERRGCDRQASDTWGKGCSAWCKR